MQRPVAVGLDDGFGLAAVEVHGHGVGFREVEGPAVGEIPLRRGGQPVAAPGGNDPVDGGARRIVIGDCRDRTAVDCLHRGLDLVHHAVARGIALNRDREAVGAGRRDRLVEQRSRGIVVRHGLRAAAVGVEALDDGLAEIEGAAAGGVALDCLGQAVGAGRDDPPRHHGAAGRIVRLRLGAAAIGIENRDIGRRLLASIGRQPLLALRQPVCAHGLDVLRHHHAAGVEITDGFGRAAVRVEHGDIGLALADGACTGEIILHRLAEAVGTHPGDGLIRCRTATVEIGHGLGRAAVGVEHRDIGAGLVEGAIAGGVAPDRDHQPAGAGGGDGLVLQRAVGAEIRASLGEAAVGIFQRQHGADGAIERALQQHPGLVGAGRRDRLRHHRAAGIGLGHGVDGRAVGVEDDLVGLGQADAVDAAVVPLPRLRQPVGAGGDDGLVGGGPGRVEVGDGLGSTLVGIDDGDVGPGLVEGSAAIGAALRRDRQAVGAGCGDRLILHRAVGIVVGDGNDGAAIAALRLHRALVDHPVTIEVAGDRDIQPVRAGRRHHAVDQRAAGAVIRHRFGVAAVGIDDRDVGPRPVESAVAAAVGLGGDRQAVGFGDSDSLGPERSAGAIIGHRFGAAIICIDHRDGGLSLGEPPRRSDCPGS